MKNLTESKRLEKLQRRTNNYISFVTESYTLTQCPHHQMSYKIDPWDEDDSDILMWWAPTTELMMFLTNDFVLFVDETIWDDLKKMFGIRFQKTIGKSFEQWFWDKHCLKCRATKWDY